ncbi:MAG: VOC family protein [Elainellaceae cyanobacterium]
MSIVELNAVASTVSDLDQSIAFYTQALGFTLTGELMDEAGFAQLGQPSTSRVRLAVLQLGNERIELMQYLDLTPSPIPPDSQSNDLWFQHMAIVVRDMDEAYAHLRKFSISPISPEPQTIPQDNPMAGGVRAFKFRDRDRHALELIWFPADKGKDKWHRENGRLFLGIDHTAIAVADTAESLQFYRDLLGMAVAGGNLNSGEVQARLDGLPVAEVQVTPLEPAETGIGLELLDYVTPGTGRPVPEVWTASDLAHRHGVLAVTDLQPVLERLRQQGAAVSSVIDLPAGYRYGTGCLVKDPNGHSLLLVS